jgi:hypothetical protein
MYIPIGIQIGEEFLHLLEAVGCPLGAILHLIELIVQFVQQFQIGVDLSFPIDTELICRWCAAVVAASSSCLGKMRICLAENRS